MRRRVGGLRDELTQLPLPDDSPLWYTFSFNRPDDPSTPGLSENRVLPSGATGTGTLIVDWNSARRANHYRVIVQVTGEAQPRAFGLFPDDPTILPASPSAFCSPQPSPPTTQRRRTGERPGKHHA